MLFQQTLSEKSPTISVCLGHQTLELEENRVRVRERPVLVLVLE
jgi:hypothetical protein